MVELQLANLKRTDITNWDFPTLKMELQQKLEIYKKLVYTDDAIRLARSDRADLNRAKKVIEDCRRTYRRQCLAPYKELEPQVKELVAMIEEQRLLLDETVKEYEKRQKQKKEAEVKKCYDKKAVVLGDLAEPLFYGLLNPRWLNITMPKETYEREMQQAINRAEDDLREIRALDSPFFDTLIEKYVGTLSIDAVRKKEAELREGLRKSNLIVTEERNKIAARKDSKEEGVAVKIFATKNQLEQICDFMKALGVTYEFRE